MADPLVPMGANPDDAILRQIVESAAYEYESPDIRAASSPRLERDRFRAAAWELLRRADVASRRPSRKARRGAPAPVGPHRKEPTEKKGRGP